MTFPTIPRFFRVWVAVLGFACSLRAGEPLKVATLSTVLTDIARNVGGDKVRIMEIVKAGIDPHEFQPSPSDIEKVAGAAVVLASGNGMEGYLSKLKESAGGAGEFVSVGDHIGPSLKLSDEGKTIDDPHWWHSVANVEKAVAVVRDAFIQADPAGKEAFARNAAAYQEKLKALDKAIRLKIAELPRDQRKLVTSHDAFQYFARDYGFTIYPIEGVSTTDEPSSQYITSLIDTIKTQKVKAVFFQNIENPKVVGALTTETGAKVGGELYADGLGTPDSDAGTYEAMMRHNVNTIVDALK